MIFKKIPIQSIIPLTEDIYLLRFSCAPIAAEAHPGQFVMVLPIKFSEPLLPRPFSIHRVRGDRLELLFKIIGQGTRQLASLQKGDLLEVRGPLGRGYDFSPDQNPILVAGGMGVAPLLFLAEAWKRSQKKNSKQALQLFLGAREKSELLRLKEFEGTGAKILTATEDGSYGRKGLVTRLLFSTLKSPSPHQTVYACGPTPMLKAVRDWAVQKGISCQISLEAHMACGLGACLGCVVAWKKETKTTYVNVCQQGPVFEAGEVFWDE